MPIFKLHRPGEGPSTGRLVPAERSKLDLEKHLEQWIENTPAVLAGDPIVWIGRQTSAPLEGSTLFPDLLGVDGAGNLVIVELKRAMAPRDVVAQLLEYSAWASELSGDEVISLAESYLQGKPELQDRTFPDLVAETFELEEPPRLNQGLRLFIVAEDIPASVSRVCRFLRTRCALDVSCIAVNVHETKDGDLLVSTETIVGLEESSPRTMRASAARWSGDKTVREVVWENVKELVGDDKNRTFTPKEVIDAVQRSHPTVNKMTVRCHLTADCVNHPSRHHYPGGQQDRYWRVAKGQFRLYDPAKDR